MNEGLGLPSLPTNKTSYNNTNNNCCVCLEIKSKGINCCATTTTTSGGGSSSKNSSSKGSSSNNNNKGGSSHFICQGCFSPYVSSICDESCKLLDTGGQIKCPVPDCTSTPWTSHDIRNIVVGDVLEKYIDILVLSVQRMQSNSNKNNDSNTNNSTITDDDKKDNNELSENEYEKQRRHDVLAIVDSLTLRCPNTFCSVALDPSPDGCCAMRCVTCGKHFCWLCFQIQQDNSINHSHVRNCGENPKPGNLFPRKDLVEIVHKQRRIEAIRKCLMRLTGEIGGLKKRKNEWQTNPRCIGAVEAVKLVLEDSGITPKEVFSSTVVGPATACSSNDFNDVSDEQADENVEGQNKMLIVLLGIEGFIGWCRVFFFLIWLLQSTWWISCLFLAAVLSLIIIWMPEFGVFYWVVGFFDVIKFIFHIRSYIIPHSFPLKCCTTLALAAGLFFSHARDDNRNIYMLHFAGIFVVDVTQYIIYS